MEIKDVDSVGHNRPQCLTVKVQNKKRVFTDKEVEDILRISKEQPLLISYEILEIMKPDYDVSKKLSYKNTINKLI